MRKSATRAAKPGKRAVVVERAFMLGGRIDYFRGTVFNHPTLDEARRVAALNGLSKL